MLLLLVKLVTIIVAIYLVIGIIVTSCYWQRYRRAVERNLRNGALDSREIWPPWVVFILLVFLWPSGFVWEE